MSEFCITLGNISVTKEVYKLNINVVNIFEIAEKRGITYKHFIPTLGFRVLAVTALRCRI